MVRRSIRSSLVTAFICVTIASTAFATTQADKKGDATGWADIRSATLTRAASTKLSWTFNSWFKFKTTDLNHGGMVLDLDTRRGSAPDYRAVMGYSPGGTYCQADQLGGSWKTIGTFSRPSSTTARCIFSSKGMKRTKPIHWRMKTDSSSSFNDDLAPNSGWAKGT
jgi:hypothetical protein